MYNTFQSGVGSIPIKIVPLLMEIYEYFYIYTVHVTQLKEFCKIVDVVQRRIVQNGSTRFFSLLPVVERILEVTGKLFMWIITPFFRFVQGQLDVFNTIEMNLKKHQIKATGIILKFLNLKYNLPEKMSTQFLCPHKERNRC